jgi:hypothetical protein
MDDELKQALGAIESRFVAIDNRFVAMDNRLVEMESRMAERIHDTETKLLKAFYDWASPADARINKALPALDERLGWVEQRVTALERRNLEQGI